MIRFIIKTAIESRLLEKIKCLTTLVLKVGSGAYLGLWALELITGAKLQVMPLAKRG